MKLSRVHGEADACRSLVSEACRPSASWYGMMLQPSTQGLQLPALRRQALGWQSWKVGFMNLSHNAAFPNNHDASFPGN